MDQTLQVETPQPFIIACRKCTRVYEIHGRESILTACLEAEGWWYDAISGNVCPTCPAPRPLPQYNKARESKRRAA